MDDGNLVQRAIDGDDTAFLQIIQLYKIDLYKTAYSFLRNEGDSLEAIQEVTYRAYKNIRSIRDSSFLKTWLIRIMINYCNDQLKKKKRLVLGDEMLNVEGNEDDYFIMEIQDAMQSLDERSREILTLKYFHDMKIKDIASSMQRPEGTVKTWLNKALKSLREKLEEKGGNISV
jgi:RNA polymerase sigma-70 factor (TIGR02954 family)